MTISPYVEAARGLANEITASAHDAEAERKMPDALVESIRAARLFHLGVPAALGGAECDMATIIDVVEEVSRADGSAGWNVFVGQSPMFLAWLEPTVAKEMVTARPDPLMSSCFAPNGKAVTDGRDLVIDGHWAFNSGCSHADWMISGVMIMDGDAPRMVPPGRPDWRFAFIPASEIEIVDTWHVAGLRGTGSHDTVARGARIPYERTIMPFYEPAKFDGPLYRLPFPTLLSGSIVGFPLGVARRAIDEFVALAQKKSALPMRPVLAEDGHIEVVVARAEAAFRAARAYVDDAIGTAWDVVCRGDELTMEQRANSVMATKHAAQTARTAVDEIYNLSGGSAIYDASPIQRCARDVAAGTQHLVLGFTQWRDAGRVLLGLPPEDIRL